MKRLLTLSLAAVMLMTVMVGCGSKPKSEEKSPEELTELFKTAIEGARDEEMNKAVAVITSPEDDMADMILPLAGITAEDATAFAIAISPINMRAYGIALVRPAADKADTVKEALQTFIDTQQANFEFYLADQYDIALAARLETLEDGSILMVMSEGQDEIFDAIKTAVEKG